MSYMKNHLENAAIKRVLDDMLATEQQTKRERLERLAWEAQAAVNDYLVALKEYEAEQAIERDRLIQADLRAGRFPM